MQLQLQSIQFVNFFPFRYSDITTHLKSIKKVAVTATTGMAALQLADFDATTIHRWSGIKTGHCSSLDLYNNILDTNPEAVERMKETDVLVIDEIGMMSKRIFELLCFVLCKVRSIDVVLGGLQVIAAGSFMQLPPVPNLYIGDEGQFIFESDLFNGTFPHHFHLTQVRRHHESELIIAVNELCRGQTTAITDKLMNTLTRPTAHLGTPVYLVSTNLAATMLNMKLLQEASCEGEIQYVATDSGK